MRIAVAQIDPVVGAFEANVAKIREAYERACAEQARLLLTPELGICGYPPHDLVERPEIFERCEKSLAELAALTQGKACALAVGLVARNPSSQGRAAQNVAVVLDGGREVFRQAKTLLPTYDVFDEARYFEPALEVKAWEFEGRRIAVAICEDLWGLTTGGDGRKFYGRNPCDAYRALKVDLVLSLSSSPYEWGKRERRESVHSEVCRTIGAPLVYVNQVGATDEILFDGASFAMSADGKSLGSLPSFEKAFGVFDLERACWLKRVGEGAPAPGGESTEIAVLHRALVTGIREYFRRTGFKFGMIGLSGGIDSAVIGVLMAEALGAQNVLGVAMPSQYSSPHSLEDAEILARNLGLRFEVRPIKFSFAMLNRELGEARGGLAPVAQENLQSRLRGVTLMALSNHYNALVVTTGNKSEMATGYCTLYGDMCGAIAPLGDVFKTRVYELAREINRAFGSECIPQRSMTKAPSAELRPDQKDQDSLPPYPLLDALLEGYLEHGQSVAELEKTWGSHAEASAAGLDPGWVKKTLRLLEINEYKRRQAAPVLKISPKAFGIGRRIPVAKRWDQG